MCINGIFTLLFHVWLDARISPANHAVQCQLFNLNTISDNIKPNSREKYKRTVTFRHISAKSTFDRKVTNNIGGRLLHYKI